jgi:hypothetical protein
MPIEHYDTLILTRTLAHILAHPNARTPTYTWKPNILVDFVLVSSALRVVGVVIAPEKVP